MIAIHRHPGWRHTVWPIAAGLATAHLLGTLFVRQSNLSLLAQTRALTADGWFSLPRGPAAASLETWAAAFWGGLFYTLSVGAILTLTTWSLLRLRDRWGRQRPRVAWCMAAAWLMLLVAVNLKGLSLYATLFAVGVPLVTVAAAWLAAPATAKPSSGWQNLIPALVLVALTAMWSTQLNQQLFITIRDHVLLPNTAGQKVNDFYYRYTLYAAEAFKAFDQKSIRTCRLDGVIDPRLKERLVKALAQKDILSVTEDIPVDLIVAPDRRQLRLSSSNGTHIDVDSAAFFKDMNRWLLTFARADDRLAPLRRVIFVGVLIGFPILLYLCVYGLLRFVIGLFWDRHRAVWITSGVCLLIGILLFILMPDGGNRDFSRDQLAVVLESDRWEERVVALRQAEKQRTDITGLMDVGRHLQSPSVVERYWLARVLAYSRGPGAYPRLLALTRDPHPNVICQAYYALGQRGDRRAIATIREQMAQSDHWYTQYYGYNAIRKLGWTQTRSRPHS